MKSNRGQALVEFVIILPITLILIFCIIDFSRVISLKSDLESITSDAITFYQDGNSQEEITRLLKLDDDITITIKEEGSYTEITTEKNISPITPGLSYINKDVFDVKVTRVVKDE